MLKRLLGKLRRHYGEDNLIHNEDLKFLQAKQIILHLEALRREGGVENIHSTEFKVFSQWGEDGIIQWIISKLPSSKPIFIEFGVANYQESNTRFLLMNNNWKGFIIDGSKANIDSVKARDFYWRHDLTAVDAFVNKDNINSLFKENGFTGDIGILSIDIDGNDYWVWDAIDCVNPQVIICEYNSVLGAEKTVVVPYEANFERTKAHYSNLYWGASLRAYELLGKKKGYSLIGCNSAGVNAFFVKDSYASFFEVKTTEQAYICSKFRDSRDREGKLSYLSSSARLEVMKEMPLFDIESGCVKSISEIYGID